MSIRRLSRDSSAIVLAVGVAVLMSCVDAQAADGSAPPVAELSVVGPDVIAVELDDRLGQRQGTVPVVVVNSGDAAATVSAAAQPDIVSRHCGKVSTSDTPTRVEPKASVVLVVTFRVAKNCDNEEGTLLVASQDSKAKIASARFKFFRDAGSVHYEWPLLASLIVLVLLVARLLAYSNRLTYGIDMGPSWSFADSWLTNVAALTAILGTILSSTGVIEDLLPGLSSGRMLALNLLFGGFVLFAPVVYSATAHWVWKQPGPGKEKTLAGIGTVAGLILSSSLSIAGSVGILATLVLIASAADVTKLIKVPVVGLILVAACFVLIYSYRWCAAAMMEAKPASDVAVTSLKRSATV